jgi:hypothetical protein
VRGREGEGGEGEGRQKGRGEGGEGRFPDRSTTRIRSLSSLRRLSEPLKLRPEGPDVE